MKELTETLKSGLAELLDGQVEVVPIPTHGDRMVKLRTLQEALAEFDAEDTVHYLIQIKAKRAPEPDPGLRSGPGFGDDEPTLDLRGGGGGGKPSLDNIYLPNGKLNIPYLVRNAEILLDTGDTSLARNIYKTILQSGQHAAAALLGMGRCYQTEGKLDEAQKLYEESIAYQPTLESYRCLGGVLIRREKHAQAADAFCRALSLKEVAPRERFELCKAAGNCWTRAGRAAEAERTFKQALELDPSADDVRSNLGVLKLQSNRITEAKRCFQDAIAVNPGNARALSGLGSCALAEGERKAAHDFFARSLEIDLANPTAVYQLVKLAYELKTHATAAKILGDYVQSAPVNPNLLYSLAGLQFHLGRLGEAESTARQILTLAPEHSGARELLALVAKFSTTANTNGVSS